MIEKYPLPEGWRWVRLEEVCATAETRDPGISPNLPFRYVDISSVDNLLKRITEARTILGKDAPSRARQIIHANDVLIATTSPNLNAVALVPKELDNDICSTGFCVLRPIEVDPLFLFMFVQTQYFIEIISGQVRGMLYPAVTDTQIRKVYLPLPPLSEQKRISTRLQELMQEVERARTAIERQLEAARALPATYIREVFENEEAKRWERKRLGEVCGIDSNQVLPNTYSTRQLPYIGLEHIENETGRIIDKINDLDGKIIQSITFRFDTRHVLYGKLRPYLNKVVTSDFEGRCTTELLPLLPKDGCDRYYLAWLLRRTETVEEAMRHKTGTRMPRADMDELFKMLVPLPPLPEQKRIASELKEKMAEVENLQSAIRNQQSALDALPQAILRKAFSGDLG